MAIQKHIPLGSLLMFAVVAAVANPLLAETLTVDCTKGDTLTKAVERAKPGDRIHVTGTCKETVTITTDRLTLDGQGSAMLDGGSVGPSGTVALPAPLEGFLPFFEGVVTIVGARGVTITGFTIQHGADGITCKGGATCIVRNTILQDNADEGIQVSHNADEGIQVSHNAAAEVADCTLRRNGEWGIVVFDNSSVLFHGTLVSHNNGFSGIGLFRNSTANTYGDVSIHAHNNGRHGIIAATSSNMFTNRGVIRVEQNAGHGVFVWGGTLFGFQNAIFIAKQNKGTGLRADDGADVTLHKSIITDNDTDVALSFGARATLTGSTIGSITCDTSSMIRGDVVCPK